VIYLDTSVALAHLLAEDCAPPLSLWDQPLVSSRLLEYETWNRIHARGLAASHGEAVRQLLARVDYLELTPAVLARALERFPLPVRTLDALQLTSIEFVRGLGVSVVLASYDNRLLGAAKALGIPIAEGARRP
jgi:hypothetical protein